MATNYKNIGFTLAFPNSVFAQGTDVLTGGTTDKYVCIHESDITGLDDSTEGSGFSVTWTGSNPLDGNNPFAGSYTGNAEKIIYGILKNYVTNKASLKAKYDTEYASDTSTTQTQGPTGLSTNGFSSFSGASADSNGNSRVQNSISLSFIYASPSVDIFED